MAVINIEEAKMQVDRKGLPGYNGGSGAGSFFRD